MYNIWFGCCGLAVSAIILSNFYTRKSIPIAQNKIFIAQVWIAVFTTVCNLGMGILQNGAHPGVSSERLLLMNVFVYFYHTLRIVNGFVYVWYILVVLDMAGSSRFRLFCVLLPTAVALAICLLGPIRKLVAVVDSSGIHHPGPLMPVLYVIGVYYMVLVSGLTVFYRKVIPFSRQLAFHSFGTLVLIPVLVERLFPTFMLECFGSVLCQLLIYLTIQRPEEVLDGVTGLPNRISFLQMLSVRFRQKASFEVVVIAIDNYQFIEKSLGLRSTGILLNKIAAYLSHLTNKAGVYRIFDGVFCLMLNRRSKQQITRLMEELKSNSVKVWSVNDLKISLKASFMRIRCPEQASCVEDVQNRMEALLPNTSGNAALGREGAAEHRIAQVERAIEEALAKGSFRVVYQPIYSASHSRFYSAEALIRLNDESLGPVEPEEFIPIAEKSGAIARIGQFVLNEVCRFLAENQVREMGIEYIEVNLSIVECLQDDLADHILGTLDRYGLDASMINLEITETASDTLPEAVIHNINRLAAAGIRFSLDDYGTGYSNIARILTMPLDIIKLDKSIIWTYFLSQTGKADIVLEETLRMLRRLDKWVVAEGVETREQAERLMELGCEYLQGYYYGKPMSAKTFLKLLDTRAVR